MSPPITYGTTKVNIYAWPLVYHNHLPHTKQYHFSQIAHYTMHHLVIGRMLPMQLYVYAITVFLEDNSLAHRGPSVCMGRLAGHPQLN